MIWLHRMLAWVSTKWRVRAAGIMVALYAMCLGIPTVVMAVSQGGIPEHCLADEPQVAGILHVHQDGSTHHHSGGKHDEGDHSEKCCGLFSASAIAPDVVVLPVPRHLDYHHVTPLADDPAGRGSDRIDRPPRSSSADLA